MKYLFAAILIGGSFLTSCTCSRSEKPVSEEALVQKRSYYLGVSLAQSVDPAEGYETDEVLQGFKDGLEGKSGIPSKEELQAFYLEEQQRRYQKSNLELIKKETAAKAYLDEMVKKESLMVSGSGIFFKVLKPGQGNSLGASDKFVAKIKGTLPDGTVFENSENNPSTLSLMNVVPGLRAISGLLKEGAKLDIYLSPQQAFGIQGKGPVPAMSAVKFEVQVMQIIRQPQQKIRL
ncbi:MAG: FKBP-type peptidyl-prolyl cis-trans isomerase [Bdellovibrio sp.]|nr:FKBP-type peptidyl-prolyl cis-trans isomerase [Bdellovibrio sp.]